MTRRHDTADGLLELRAELRRRYRIRKTVNGPVRQEIEPAPPARGETRKNTVRALAKLGEHLAERRWFYRLSIVQARYYLGIHRLEPRIASWCAMWRALHEAKYPDWPVTEPPRLPESMSADGIGSMILAAVRSGTTAVLPPGPLVDRLNAGLIRNPQTPYERQIVKAAKKRVRVRLGRRAHAAALEKRTTTKRSANRKTTALTLLKAGKTQKQVAEQLDLDVRTIRRYQRGQ